MRHHCRRSHLRDGDEVVTAKVAALTGAILLSVVSRVELEAGVYRDIAQDGVRRPRLNAISAALPVLVFDEVSCLHRNTVENQEENDTRN